MVKDPDFAELAEEDPSLTPEQRLDNWRDDFEMAEQAVTDGNPETAFDIESFINYMLVFDIALNNEFGHPKSVYIHKKALGADELYHFGPIWDFDFTFQKIKNDGEGDYEAPLEYQLPMHAMFKNIYESGDVKQKYIEKFKNFVEEIYPDLLQWIDEYAALVRPSAKLNGGLWTRDDSIGYVVALPSFDHENHVAQLKSWLERRVKYLCSQYDVPVPAE